MDSLSTNERLMLAELESAGYHYNDINDIHYQKEISAEVAQIILKWLPAIYKDHLGSGEHLVRALISAQEPFDPAVLIDLFENSNYNETIKWTLAYVLSISKTYDISAWLRNELLNKESSFERDGLIYGLTTKAGIKDVEELMFVLKKLFDKYCYFEGYLKLFGRYANKEDIIFLLNKIEAPKLKDYLDYVKNADKVLSQNRAKNADKTFEKEIRKLIARIQKRKIKHRLPIFPRS